MLIFVLRNIGILYHKKAKLPEHLQHSVYISSHAIGNCDLRKDFTSHFRRERDICMHGTYNPQIRVVYNPTLPDWHDKNLHVQKSTQADSRAWRLIWTLVVEFAVKICNIIFICFFWSKFCSLSWRFRCLFTFSGRNAEMKLAIVEVFYIVYGWKSRWTLNYSSMWAEFWPEKSWSRL